MNAVSYFLCIFAFKKDNIIKYAYEYTNIFNLSIDAVLCKCDSTLFCLENMTMILN